jgi:hypothetical protein
VIKQLVLGALILFSFDAWAQVEGQGRFQALEEDSVTFVRNQLIASATRDVVTKELKAMGLDADGFWARLNQRFELAFASVHDELKEKHRLVDAENVTARQREAFEREVRARRLNMQANFGGLARAISSYSIRSQSRSTQGGALRFMTIQARVDRRVLNSIYSDFMREGRARYFQSLIMTLDFELREASWSDLGVTVSGDLTKVLENHWSGILRGRLNRQVGTVVVADAELKQRVEQYLRIPREVSESLAMGTTNLEIDTLEFTPEVGDSDETPTELVVQQEGITADKEEQKSAKAADLSRFGDSLLLQVRVSVTKTEEDESAQTRSFLYQGELLLIDLRDQTVLASFEFPREEHGYQTHDTHQLSSSIATQIARMPSGEFERYARVLSGVRSDRAIVRLKLQEMTSIQDFYAFTELLMQKGVTAEFTPRLVTFSGREAQIDLDYKGDPLRMMDILRGLDSEVLTNQAMVMGLNSDRPYEFRLFTPISEPTEGESL